MQIDIEIKCLTYGMRFLCYEISRKGPLLKKNHYKKELTDRINNYFALN